MAIDRRFYSLRSPALLSKLINDAGVLLEDIPEVSVSGVSELSQAGSGDLCFLQDAARQSDARIAIGRGAICLGPSTLGDALDFDLTLSVDAPRPLFFQMATQMITMRINYAAGNDPDVNIHKDAIVHPTAIMSKGVAIGAGSHVGPYTCLGAGVQIGSNCEIGTSTHIECALIGNGVAISSGARIGNQGFGLLPSGSGLTSTPHFGRVIVQDYVRIGANSCIDRGVLGDTVIGEGSKIDNLCHIGHNTILGRHVVMAAFAGISGSVTIADNVLMGGRVGIVDHVSIGKGARLAADAAVFSSVPAGETWAGSPARPLKQWQRETIWLKNSTKSNRKQVSRD